MVVILERFTVNNVDLFLLLESTYCCYSDLNCCSDLSCCTQHLLPCAMILHDLPRKTILLFFSWHCCHSDLHCCSDLSCFNIIVSIIINGIFIIFMISLGIFYLANLLRNVVCMHSKMALCMILMLVLCVLPRRDGLA